MKISNMELAAAILVHASTGRPVIISKGFNGDIAVQCNGAHFIQNVCDPVEQEIVGQTLDELVAAGPFSKGEWQGCNRRLYLTEYGCRVMDTMAATPA